MGLFGGGGLPIGLDIGTGSIKVAEISKKGKSFKLQKFGIATLVEGAIIEDEFQKEEEIIEAIDEGLKEANIKSKNVCFGIFGPNTIVRKLQIEGGDIEEIEDQVEWESEQYLPFPIEEAKMDYHILGENEGGGLDIIIAAAREDIFNNFMDLIKQAKLKTKAVDLNMIALVNVFELVMKDKIEGATDSYIILDVGSQLTKFVVYKSGTIMFSKEVPVGGVNYTEEIQRQMGVNFIEAEDLKIIADEEGNLPEEVMSIIEQVTEVVVGEIVKTSDFYINSSSDEGIVSCYVTGGAVRTPGLLDGIEAALGVPVEILNPFEVITYNDNQFDDDEINEVIHSGLVAIGLAMNKG